MEQTDPPAKVASNEGFGVTAAHCWPWSHVYGQWVSSHTVEKRRTSDGALVASGVQQQQRCIRCGKVLVRLAMAGL